MSKNPPCPASRRPNPQEAGQRDSGPANPKQLALAVLARIQRQRQAGPALHRPKPAPSVGPPSWPGQATEVRCFDCQHFAPTFGDPEHGLGSCGGEPRDGFRGQWAAKLAPCPNFTAKLIH